MHCDRLRVIFISHDSVRITCCVPNYTDDSALSPSQISAVFFVLLPDQKGTRNNNNNNNNKNSTSQRLRKMALT